MSCSSLNTSQPTELFSLSVKTKEVIPHLNQNQRASWVPSAECQTNAGRGPSGCSNWTELRWPYSWKPYWQKSGGAGVKGELPSTGVMNILATPPFHSPEQRMSKSIPGWSHGHRLKTHAYSRNMLQLLPLKSLYLKPRIRKQWMTSVRSRQTRESPTGTNVRPEKQSDSQWLWVLLFFFFLILFVATTVFFKTLRSRFHFDVPQRLKH